MARLDPGTITKLLNRADKGEFAAREELLELVYPELVAQAKRRLRHEPLLKAKDPESLVHDVLFNKLPHQKDDWKCRVEFYGYAKRAMWQVCVDEVRRVLRRRKAPLPTERTPTWGISLQTILEIEEALEKLAKIHDTRLVQVVRLRFIEQRSVAMTAKILGVSERTVEQDWSFARAWLRRELSRGDTSSAASPVI
jgi:RNA polymerase sigma factor (TIGR02999 family)